MHRVYANQARFWPPGISNQGGVVDQLRQRRSCQARPTLDVSFSPGELVANGVLKPWRKLLLLREGLDVEAITLVRWHGSRGVVGPGYAALSLQVGHLIPHSGRADAQGVLLGDGLGRYRTG